MKTEASAKAFTGAGLLSAFAASLCCITPFIALIAGSSSVAVNFSWIEPARPYLIGLSVAVLLFAWYRKLKPISKADNCNCEPTSKTPFLQTKTFLGIVTIFAVVMMTFPLYAKIFYPKPKVQSVPVAIVNNKQQVSFDIKGMSCEACEEHVNTELSKVKGIITYATSYANKNSVITFDTSIVDISKIEAAINNTGYKAVNYKILNLSK